MSSVTLLFWNGGALSEEWLATAAGIAITFFVFIMGVPAFVLQTFIAGNLRDVYYERIGKKWRGVFVFAIFCIVLIFLAGHEKLDTWVLQCLGCSQQSKEKYVSWVVVICLVLLFIVGIWYLWRNFVSARSIEKFLSERVVQKAQKHYRSANTKALEHDLEHLSIMALEVRAGMPKKHFLEQCEHLIESIIPSSKRMRKDRLSSLWHTDRLPWFRRNRASLANQQLTRVPHAILRRILQEIITPSVEGGRAKVSSENRKQALDLLAHTYNKARRNGDHSYLVVTIGHCMQEIGLAALKHNDHPALMDAIEKMAEIQGRYKEMFIVSTAAFWENQVKPAIAAARKFESVLHTLRSAEEAEQRKYALYYWLGLLANLHLKKGAALEFAERQLRKFEPLLTHEAFDNAYDHFANRMAYFDTADSVRRLRDERFPPPVAARSPLARSK
jgi:hypothetical protein